MPKIEYVDPELQFDILPEPYKSIDEIVRNIIDNSWNRIRDRATLPTIGRYRGIFHHTKIEQDSQNWLLQNEEILGKVVPNGGTSPSGSSYSNNAVSLLLTNDTIASAMTISPVSPTSLKTFIPSSLSAIPSVISLSLTKLFTRTGTGGAMALPGEQLTILGTNYGDVFMVPRETIKGNPLLKLSIFRNFYTLVGTDNNGSITDGTVSIDKDKGLVLPLPDKHSIEDLKLSSYAITTLSNEDNLNGNNHQNETSSSSTSSSSSVSSVWIDTLYFQDGIVCLPEITTAPSGDHYITPIEPVHSVSFSPDASTAASKPPLNSSFSSKPSTASGTNTTTNRSGIHTPKEGISGTKSASFEFTNATGVDETQNDEETKMARRLGLNKPKMIILPTWHEDEGNRGFLIIAGSNAIGTTAEIPGLSTHTFSTVTNDKLTLTPILPTGVVRIFHVPAEALRSTNGTNLMRYAAYDPLSSNATQQYLDKQASGGTSNQYIPPVRWLATATLPIGVQVCEIDTSMDGRYISILGSDAHVRVYHLHPSVVTPPPLEIKKDEALIALKVAAAALLGEDNAEELDDEDDYSSQDEEKKEERITRTSSKLDEFEPKYPLLPPPVELPILYDLSPPKVDPLTSITASILGDKYRIPRKFTPPEEPKPVTETTDTTTTTASATNSRPSSSATTNSKTASRPTSSNGGNANTTSSPSKSGGTASKPGSAKSTKGEPEVPVTIVEPLVIIPPVTTPPPPPIPLITGFHFVSTRLHSPGSTAIGEQDTEEANDRGSIGGSATGSRANPSVLQQNTAKNSVLTNPSSQRNAKSSVVTHAVSVSSRNSHRADDASSTVPPRLPPNRIGHNGVPVTTGCIIWWSVDTNAPGGNTPAALALNEVLRHIQRYTIDPLANVNLPLGSNPYAVASSSSSSKSTKSVTHSLLPSPKYSYCYTPVPFHPTVSSISINSLTYQHSMVYENDFPSFSSPLIVIGDDLGNINVFAIGTVTVPIIAFSSSNASVFLPSVPQPIPGALIPKGSLGKHTAYPNVYSMYHNHHTALSSVSVYDRENTNELSVYVTSVSISSDNKWIISGSAGGQIFIYDVQSTIGPGYDRYPRPTIASLLIPSSTNDTTMTNGTVTSSSSSSVVSGGTSATNTLKGMGLIGGNMHWLRNNQLLRKDTNNEIDQVLRLPCSLHAARWDGLGEIISIRMLTDVPLAIVEAYEPVTDRRGELLSLETTATAAPRVLYVYDVPAGTLLCTIRPGGTKASMLDDPSTHPSTVAVSSVSQSNHTLTVRKLLRNSTVPNPPSPTLASSKPDHPSSSHHPSLYLTKIGNGVRGKGGLWKVYPDGVFFLTNLTVLDRSSTTSQSVSSNVRAPPSVQLHSFGVRSLLKVGYPILGKAMERIGISIRQNKGGGNGIGAGLHSSSDIDSVRNASRFVLQLYNALPQEEREIIQGKNALALIMGNASSIDNENKNYIVETKAQNLVNLILQHQSSSSSPNLYLPPTDIDSPGSVMMQSSSGSTMLTNNPKHTIRNVSPPKRKTEYTETITAKGDIFRCMGRLPPVYSNSGSSVSSTISSLKYAFIPPALYTIDDEEEGDEGNGGGSVPTQNYTVRNGNQYTYELASYYDTIRKVARDTREYRIGNRSKTMVALLNREYLG